jgi:uncharacterized protein YjdB
MLLRCLAILAALVVAAVAYPGHDAFGADQLCRSAQPARAPRGAPPFPAFTPRLGVTVGDALSHGASPPERLLDLETPDALCVGVGDGADVLPLAGYTAKPTGPRPRRFQSRAHAMQTRFGIHQLRVTRGPDRVLFPAVWAPGTTLPLAELVLANGGRFACYRVTRRGRPPMRPLRVPLQTTDDTMPRMVDLLRPTRLCLPASINGDDPGAVIRDRGLLCFATHVPTQTDRPRPSRQLVAARTVLDPAVLKVGTPYELCVGAGAPDPTLPTPVATPPGGGGATPVPTVTIASPAPSPGTTPTNATLVSLAIEPRRAALKPGETMVLTAMGTFSDGSTHDITQDVTWLCDYGYEYSCSAPNQSGDRSRIYALNVTPYGSVTAFDPANDQVGDSIPLEVALAPAPLIVYPYYQIIRQFDFDYLTALRLQDGGYRNATQQVVWSSSNPRVAAATNPPGARSRIDGVGPGTATIVATDPMSGSVSDPVSFEVFGPLNSLEVRAFGAGTSSLGATILDVGDTAWAATWGYFDYGFTFEQLRGGVTLTSSAPAVAALEPLDQLVPRTTAFLLKAETPGVAVVSAHDPLTGFGSSEHGCDLRVTVRNPAVALRLQPELRRVGLGEIVRLTALGVAVDGTTRNLTQRVTYTSSDPSVVVPMPDPYLRDRSRLLTVGAGVATITAIADPVYGRPQLTTNPSTVATIMVRNEHLTRIVVEPALRHTIPETLPRFVARGFYPSGASNLVTDSVAWTSSAPEVAEQSPYAPSRLEAHVVGTATITATLPATGVSSHATSDDGTLVVEAPVGLTVVPATTTLAVGATVTVTALAHLPSGATIDLLDREITPDPRWAPVFFRTSAPGVARSTNVCRAGDYVYPAQPIVGVAPGTATIRATSWATDPPTESGAGGSATITVGP